MNEGVVSGFLLRFRYGRGAPFIEVVQQPAAIDNLFHKIGGQVEVLAGWLETDARIFARERVKFSGQGNFGFK